ncbi:MAG: hypothetical protein AAGC86_13985 [Pseudomonadota bacterium]
MDNSARFSACLTAARFLPGLPAGAREVCGDFIAYYRINDVYTDDRGAPGPGLENDPYPLCVAGHVSVPRGP